MKNKLLIVLAFVLCLVLLCGCGASSPMDYIQGSIDSNNKGFIAEDGFSAEGFYGNPEAPATAPDASVGVLDARKLIKTVYLTIQTKYFEDYVETVKTTVAEFNGYIEKSDISSYKSYDRRAEYTIRIPSDRLDAFTSHISANGVVVSTTSSQDDVTLTYVDMEAHVKALKVQEESLLRLLSQAETVEDIISIEDRLSYVRYEIDSYESQLRTYDSLINYSTVYLDIEEVEREEPVTEPETVWGRIGKNLKNAVYHIWQFLKNLFVFLISALPYIALITVTALPVLYFTVFRPARKRKKAQKKNNNNP